LIRFLAYRWFNIAAIYSGTGVKERDTLARRMTAKQVIEAERQSLEWLLANL
jgi:hypothetical protein